MARLLGNSRFGFTVPTVLSVLTSVDSGTPVHLQAAATTILFLRARLYADATTCLHYVLISDAQSPVTYAALMPVR